MQNSPLLAIVGPTASGKSDLAMQVAKKYNGELICADSRTVYKGMDIGTAKPSAKDRHEVIHHLLDVVSPDQLFTAARFKELAIRAIEDITRHGKLPIMVGGTGLYADAVLFDYQFGKPADPKRRAQLEQMTTEELQEMCREDDIEIPFNAQNRRHLIRALELNGLPSRQSVMRPNTLVVGISTDRELLRQRITTRVHAMVKEGILDEVLALAQEYGWNSEAMTGNIYRIYKAILEGTKTQGEAFDESVRSDMSLAKRQLTWFKRNPNIVWDTPEQLMHTIDDFLIERM